MERLIKGQETRIDEVSRNLQNQKIKTDNFEFVQVEKLKQMQEVLVDA